jgi:hypothetical protein
MAVNFSGSLVASGSIISTLGFTGSLSGTSSYAAQANTASFALTASYISGSGGGVGFPFSGSAIITGSLFVSGSTISGSFVGDGSGITGLAAGGKIHTQTSAASTWTVTHNLGVQYPNVTVYDNSNNVIIPQTIVATDVNTLTLTFGSAVAGYAVAGIGGIINVQGRTTQQYFTASTTWSFAHNLGDKYVSLQAFDDAFEMMIPTTIRLVDFTSSLLLFDSASSGYAVATIGGDLPAISSSYAGYTLQVANSAPYSASWVAVPNVTVTNAVSSSFAATASSADNLTVRGTLTAQTINVQTITSSIDFVTGSTRNGSLAANTHQFTGSVLMSGSLGIGTSSPSGKLDIRDTNITIPALGSTGTGFNIRRSDGAIGLMIGYENAVGGIYLQAQHMGGSATSYPLLLQPNGGNVGIGTSSPTDLLSLSGSQIGLSINSQTTGDAYIRFRIDGTVKTDMYVDRATDNFLIGPSVSSTLILKTNATERMRITSGGQVSIGTTSTVSTYLLNVKAQTGAQAINITGRDNADGAGVLQWTNQYGTYLGYIEVNSTAMYVARGSGGVYITTNATSWTSNSDSRLKNIISPVNNALDKLSALNPVIYSWKSDDTNKENIGLIAQDVESVLPQVIDTNKDGYLGVRYVELVPVLVKAIQELSAKNTTLEERLTALENK